VPELPDVVVYVESLERRIVGETLERIRLGSPFLLRSVAPKLEGSFGRRVLELRRIGKRIAIGLDGDFWLVLHLMIAGRLRWKPSGAKIPGRLGSAAFDFSSGTLLLTEAGSKKRASLTAVLTPDLASLDPGGLEPLEADLAAFNERLRSANHTLKRALTNPRLFSGIGNAYSDEILHRARLSPVRLTSRLEAEEVERLHRVTVETLEEWLVRLRGEAEKRFPEKVTAFRPEMAVHGKYGEPCPVCGSRVERIRYASNETNYCPRCQTGGRVLADRSLSKLLKQDWPRTVEEWEASRGTTRPS